MPPTEAPAIRIAGTDDLPAITALRESVGWGVHDWALRAVIDADDARMFVATDDGVPVAVGSGIDYGTFGVVGNMIVAEAHRRRGLGSAILRAVIGFLGERGIHRMELSATEMGRPLYAGFGFDLDAPGVSATIRREALAGIDGADVREAGMDDEATVGAFDADRFGGDRRRLLRMMLADPNRPVLVAEAPSLAGWAWIRPDAGRIGPVVADSPAVAVALVRCAFARMEAVDELRLSMPARNERGVALLSGLGAAIEPWEGRMARGPAVTTRRDDTIYAGAVGALG